MDIEECKEKGFIRKARKDRFKARSLIEISNEKEETVRTANLSEKNINSYLTLAYDSLREVIEAFCLLSGHKITNHVCAGKLVKQEYKEFDYNTFDRVRYARNSINYYGKKTEFEQGKQLIEKAFKLKKQVLKGIERTFSENT